MTENNPEYNNYRIPVPTRFDDVLHISILPKTSQVNQSPKHSYPPIKPS